MVRSQFGLVKLQTSGYMVVPSSSAVVYRVYWKQTIMKNIIIFIKVIYEDYDMVLFINPF